MKRTPYQNTPKCMRGTAGNQSRVPGLVLFIMVMVVCFNVSVAQSWVNVGPVVSIGVTEYLSLAMDRSGTPFLAYSDPEYNDKVSVKKYDGRSWAYVDLPGFSADKIFGVSLVIDANGTLYVAYHDYIGADPEIKVKKYNGMKWVNVGGGEPYRSSYFTDFAIGGDGTPYIACRVEAVGEKVRVMKCDGAGWVPVGIPGLSAGVTSCALAIGSGIPYAAYLDSANGERVSVMKYNGSDWEIVGNAGFSVGAVNNVDLKIDGSGTPYVAYLDNVDKKATVMKYDGSRWVNVGIAGFSPCSVQSVRLAIDGTGTPYVAFADGCYVSKATVMRYKGGSWVPVGSAGFSQTIAYDNSFAIDGNGTPYLACNNWYWLGTCTTTVQKPDLEVLVSLWPNPLNGDVFEVSAPEAGYMSVYSMDGREVAKFDVKVGTTEMTLPSSCATGVYICRFTSKEGGVAIRLVHE